MRVHPLTLVLGAATVAFPLLVHAGLTHLPPQAMVAGLAGVTLLRALMVRQRLAWAIAAGTAVLAVIAVASQSHVPGKLYPVLVNAAFLAVFAASLRHPPSAIERIARLREPDLPPQGVAYTRRVTQVWCGFFVVNGALAAATALWASTAVWALYTGVISYGLMALLFMGEWFVRQRVRAGHAGGAVHG